MPAGEVPGSKEAKNDIRQMIDDMGKVPPYNPLNIAGGKVDPNAPRNDIDDGQIERIIAQNSKDLQQSDRNELDAEAAELLQEDDDPVPNASVAQQAAEQASQQSKKIMPIQPRHKIQEATEEATQANQEVDETKPAKINLMDKKSGKSKNQDIMKHLPKIVIAIVILVIIISAIANKGHHSSALSDSKATGSKLSNSSTITNAIELGGYKLYNPTISTTKSVYTDYMYVNKYITVEDGSVNCYLTGITVNSKSQVHVNVDVNTYNRYVNGTEIKVTFRLMKIDGKVYAVDAKVG